MIAPETLTTAVVGLRPGAGSSPKRYSVPATTGSRMATISRAYWTRYSDCRSRHMACASSTTVAPSNRYTTGMKNAAQYHP